MPLAFRQTTRRRPIAARAAKIITSAGIITLACLASSVPGTPAALAAHGSPAGTAAAVPAGPITGVGGKCLDNAGGLTANGNKIQLWDCDGLSRQQWSLPGDGTIRVQGNHCLAVQGAGTASQTPVWLYDCDGGPAQIWTVKANGEIVNNHSGLCLADKGASTTNGNPIWVYTCDGGPAQLWKVPASQVDPSGQPMPVGDLPGWHQIFTDNFATPVPLGSFPSAVSSKWTAYSGFTDTYHNGTYDPAKVISIANGVMTMHLHTENGVHLVSAPIPIIPGTNAYQGQTYGRYAVRFRADPVVGYKTAWLLWPDDDNWQEGEIDFPEGNLDGQIDAFMHHRGSPQTQEAYPTSVSYSNWHTAVIEWTPSSVKYLLDGTVIGNDTNTAVLPNSPMRWTLQTETTQAGPADSAAGNVQIDWVAMYSRQ
jgi:ricin-type beta-trefoil lectin protein/glycosyl hydrolase family 16